MRYTDGKNEDEPMKYGIARLLALDAVEMCSAKDYINWAMKELESGSTESSIAILAGLNSATTYFEVKEAFGQVLNELGIEEYSDEEKLNHYIEEACKEIVAGRIDYQEFLDFSREAQFSKKIGKTKYSLTNFYLLSWAIQDLKAGEPSWSNYYEDLNTVFPERSVKLECEIVIGIKNPESSPRFQQTQKMKAISSEKLANLQLPSLLSKLKKILWK